MTLISTLNRLEAFPHWALHFDFVIAESPSKICFEDLRPSGSLSKVSEFGQGIAWSSSAELRWMKREAGFHFVLISDDGIALPSAHRPVEIKPCNKDAAPEPMLLWSRNEGRIPFDLEYPHPYNENPRIAVSRYWFANSAREISRYTVI